MFVISVVHQQKRYQRIWKQNISAQERDLIRVFGKIAPAAKNHSLKDKKQFATFAPTQV
jgi:hypothetical protein